MSLARHCRRGERRKIITVLEWALRRGCRMWLLARLKLARFARARVTASNAHPRTPAFTPLFDMLIL